MEARWQPIAYHPARPGLGYLSPAWKTLHMGVYLAYGLIVLHVAYGALKWETHPALHVLIFGSVACVGALHVIAARRSNRPDRQPTLWRAIDGVRYIDAGPPGRIPESRALPVCPPGQERIALVRWDGKVAALHGVCAHQGGPLYEGKVIDGCLTCPWHGWTYRPTDGKSPPPFEEELPTYRLRLSDDGHILVDPRQLGPDEHAEPLVLPTRLAGVATSDGATVGGGLPGDGLPGDGLPGDGLPGDGLPGDGSGRRGGGAAQGGSEIAADGAHDGDAHDVDAQDA